MKVTKKNTALKLFFCMKNNFKIDMKKIDKKIFSIIIGRMWKHIVGQSLFENAVLIILFFSP